MNARMPMWIIVVERDGKRVPYNTGAFANRRRAADTARSVKRREGGRVFLRPTHGVGDDVEIK